MTDMCYMLISPKMYEYLKRATARAVWKAQYRKERLLRRGIVETDSVGVAGTFEGIKIVDRDCSN